MEIEYIKASYSRKVYAGLIDAALSIGFLVLFLSPMPILVIFILYRLVTIALFDSTLGMKVFKLVFLNADQEPLNATEKLLASVFVLYEGVDYYRECKKRLSRLRFKSFKVS